MFRDALGSRQNGFYKTNSLLYGVLDAEIVGKELACQMNAETPHTVQGQFYTAGCLW